MSRRPIETLPYQSASVNMFCGSGQVFLPIQGTIHSPIWWTGSRLRPIELRCDRWKKKKKKKKIKKKKVKLTKKKKKNHKNKNNSNIKNNIKKKQKKKKKKKKITISIYVFLHVSWFFLSS